MEHFPDSFRDSAEFEVSTLGACGAHQADQRSQPAAVDELHLVKLQHHVAMLVDGVTDLRMQGKNFISGDIKYPKAGRDVLWRINFGVSLVFH